MFFNSDECTEYFKNRLSHCPDLTCKTIKCGEKDVVLVYLKSMVDKKLMLDGIIAPLIDAKKTENISNEVLKSEKLKCGIIEECDNNEQAISLVLKNNVLLVVMNEQKYLAIDIESYVERPPSEPPTSAVLKGPREGFTESIKTNITLLRRRLPSESFFMEEMRIGRYTKTQVIIAYIDGIASPKLVKNIKKKLLKIDIDGVIDSYYVLEFLEEHKNSIFKQVGSCEKPDIVSAKMLEGRVAILVDNSPIVLTLPFVLLEDIQSSNDYYGRSQYASFIRIVRMIGIFISILVPGGYLSLRLYHYKIIPLKFLITISNSTQGLPFTPFIELLFILILFEVLYEVSLRLPRYLGLATSIVGALILGDTGVKAGLISPPGVMIIALSVISIYTIPDQVYQLSLIRLVFLLLGGMLGILGIACGVIFFINHLCGLDSYEAPYLAPFAPHIKSDMKDAIFKDRLSHMKERPKSFPNINPKRMDKL